MHIEIDRLNDFLVWTDQIHVFKNSTIKSCSYLFLHNNDVFIFVKRAFEMKEMYIINIIIDIQHKHVSRLHAVGILAK